MALHSPLCPCSSDCISSLYCVIYASSWTEKYLIWFDLIWFDDYVIIIALDFSKAFDTVRHSALLDKFADLEIPDNVYNWLVEFFQGHSHCTIYGHRTTTLREISASTVQGSAIGPASYVVTASDLTTIAGSTMQVCGWYIPNYLCTKTTSLAQLNWTYHTLLVIIYILIVPSVLNWSSQSQGAGASLTYRHVFLTSHEYLL